MKKFNIFLLCFILIFNTCFISVKADTNYYDSSYYLDNNNYDDTYKREYFCVDIQYGYNDEIATTYKYATIIIPEETRVCVYKENNYTYRFIMQNSDKGEQLQNNVYLKIDGSISTEKLTTYLSSSVNGTSNKESIILYTSLYVFDNLANANNYINTGNTTGAIQSPSKVYNGENLKLTTMDIQYFDSNSYEESFIEYYYTCDNSLIGSTIEFDYVYTYGCSTIFNADGYGKTGTCHLSWNINENNGTIRIYLKDLPCIDECLSSVWFNDEPISKRNVMGYGGQFYVDSVVYKVDTSRLDIVANITSGNTLGNQYNFSVDLVSGKADTYTNTPDSNGDYTYNDDYKQNNGNYLTIVGRDNWGNTTFDYYYVDYKDNSRTQVTNYPSNDGEDGEDGEDGKDGTSSSTTVEGNNITNTNNNNPTFENNVNVNVSDDDVNVELDGIVEDTLENENNNNFLALFLGMFFVLENNEFLRAWGAMFGWLPLEVQGLMFSAIAICAGIGVYKLFKR